MESQSFRSWMEISASQMYQTIAHPLHSLSRTCLKPLLMPDQTSRRQGLWLIGHSSPLNLGISHRLLHIWLHEIWNVFYIHVFDIIILLWQVWFRVTEQLPAELQKQLPDGLDGPARAANLNQYTTNLRDEGLRNLKMIKFINLSAYIVNMENWGDSRS